MAMPILNALPSRLELRLAPLIRGHSRPGLGESLLFSTERQLPLEGDGTLRSRERYPSRGRVPGVQVDDGGTLAPDGTCAKLHYWHPRLLGRVGLLGLRQLCA